MRSRRDLSRLAPRVRAFAHRGGAYHPAIVGLENTRQAFEHAVRLGYRYLETDVHVTRDGVLIAFHDEVLDRVTDRRGRIAELTLAEVRRARVGGRHPVPTLAELFDAFADVEFNIDLKAEAAVEALARFLADRGEEDRVVVGSFSPGRLNRFRRLTRGRVATSAHLVEVAAYRFLPSARFARWVCGPRAVALQIPHRRRLGPVRVTIATPGLVRRAHRAGLEVQVWTVDDPAEMHALLDRGVDGLFTDRTDLLRQVLCERGDWCGQGPAQDGAER